MITVCLRSRLTRLPIALVVASVLGSCSATTPVAPERPSAVRRGDSAFRDGQWEIAISEYRTHLNDVERDPFTARALYKSALAAYRLERYEETLGLLGEMEAQYPDYHWVQVEALRGDTRYKMQQPVVAVQSWDSAWALGGEADHLKLRRRVESALDGMNDVELASARRVVVTDGVARMVDAEIQSRQPAELIEPDVAATDEAERLADVAGVQAAPVTAPPAPVEEEVRTAPETAVPEVREADVTEPEAADEEPLEPAPAAEAPPAQVADVTEQAPVAAASPEERIEPVDVEVTTGRQDVASAVARALQEEPAEAAGIPEPEPQVSGVEQAEAPAAAAVAPAALSRQGARAAAILSLTGDDRNLGAERLRGLRVAFAGAEERLLIRDTGTEPGSARRLLGEVAADPSVVVVVSLLRGEESRALAQEARKYEIPLVFLSDRKGTLSQFAVEVGAGAAPIDVLLEYALSSAGVQRFAMVHPDAPGAELRASAFRASVQQRGGQVVGTQAYAPTAVESVEGTLLRWRAERQLQALFVADGVEAVSTLAAFLGREMPEVLLLGVDGWQDVTDRLAGEPGRPGRFLFTSGLGGDSDRAATRNFAEAFEKRYRQPPMMRDAQVYDAAKLARIVVESDRPSRAQAVTYLRSRGSVAGATGDLLVRETAVERNVLVVLFQDGRLQELAVEGTR